MSKKLDLILVPTDFSGLSCDAFSWATILAREFNAKIVIVHVISEKDAVDMLSVYDWPGNVRQLKNEMERLAILLQEGEVLRSSNLSEVIQQSALLKSKGGGNKLKNSIDAIQKKMVLDALQRYQWNKTRAANDLGISRRGLLKMIERYELDRRKKPRKKGS